MATRSNTECRLGEMVGKCVEVGRLDLDFYGRGDVRTVVNRIVGTSRRLVQSAGTTRRS